MKKSEIYLGGIKLNDKKATIDGSFVEIGGEKFYKIRNYNKIPDFFMSIVSDSDHWMFISSNGSLSAGRKNRDSALFPYYSDDKIHDYCGITGSKSIILVEKEGKTFLWEPFSKPLETIYNIERNLYKSIYGNKIVFEEINNDLEISFRYGWYNSDKFGFVKQSQIKNNSNKKFNIEVLDGIRNILPYGFDYSFQNEYSNLLDAYKKNELLKESSLGIFSLSSIPVDRAEPSESLKATTVWTYGLQNCNILISDNQLGKFLNGLPVQTEIDIRAARGAYYINTTLQLDKEQMQQWMFIADVNQDSANVANLNQFLLSQKNIDQLVRSDINSGTSQLISIVASADGVQISQEELCSARHFSNTLYNVMRGGIYLNNYQIEKSDFRKFVAQINKEVNHEFETFLNDLPEEISNHKLIELAEKTSNNDLLRICYEYLPLTFSRRHGDPSRPWNIFSIDTKNEDGSPKSDYQGNWRDIFQNWEALSLSYPEFIENIISKFVNASTPDGYNPYRIMRNGIDWECPDPEDPWAYIGYWGDHQIIYLQKLLELSSKYHPGKLDELFTKEVFAYANVPYRIKSYHEIVQNPQDTIVFAPELNDKIKLRVKEIGADGRLLFIDDTHIYHVNLTEKILVSLLSKLSNFVPEAGIWLNTQRPEWNDANNALVGSGVSMVTLYYLRRFLKFWNEKLNNTSVMDFSISEEVVVLFDRIYSLFAENTAILDQGFSDTKRRLFVDTLGEAGADYRNKIYNNAFSGSKKRLTTEQLVAFTALTLEYIDQSIGINKREDGLYHAYNLLSFNEEGISIRYLYEMLEGQVAVLSSGYLTTEESLNVFDSLKRSALFREDQYSYILYPNRDLPRFNEKNNIPANRVRESKLLTKLIADKDTSIISRDSKGGYHFNGTFRNAEVLEKVLYNLKSNNYKPLVAEEKKNILSIYEEMFDHQSFTGRSGTFFGYEGLGSIYWHMVSKLLLASQECFFKAVDEKADKVAIGKLTDSYYEIKAGIGLYKSPELYGAFPTDPYSHTPAHAGAKQPGMTGQVKEDVISRMGELGVRVDQGEIAFDTSLLNKNELLKRTNLFEYYSTDGKKNELDLTENQLGFTICQVPVLYSLSNKELVTVFFRNGKKEEMQGNILNKKVSNLIFNRTGEVHLVEVSIKKDN
jgi:hypothetical protein